MIIVKPEAEADLAEASQWYESKRTGLGVDFLFEVERALERIAERPQGYPKIQGELRRCRLRRFPFGVFYLASESAVTIYAVLHQRRAPAEWQRRF